MILITYSTTDEEEYLFDMPFASSLKIYAKQNGIRLGEFQRCIEIHSPKETSRYLVNFSRVHEKGFNEKITAIVTENNGAFHFSISSEPIF